MTLEEQYLNGKSLRDLAKEYEVSHISIRNLLLKKGVMLRKCGKQTPQSLKKRWESKKHKWKEICKKISKANDKEKNSQWKNGWAAIDKKIVKDIFDKYNGICQDCGKQLFKNKKGMWVAHHIDTTLKHNDIKNYRLTKKRILFCNKCHKKRHKKNRKTEKRKN